MARDPHIAARRDVPAAHLVAAAPVRVRIADVRPGDAHRRQRSGHRTLAQCRRRRDRNDRQERSEHEEPLHDSHATTGLLALREAPVRNLRSGYPTSMPTADFGKLEKVLRLGEGRRMKRLAAQADYIASLEPDFQKLSDDELRGTTVALRERLENGEPLDELLFEAYAAVREARWRESQQRMFDVQMMGGIVLHEGIAEMKTGEGKTFVAALALYLKGSRHRRPPRHDRQRLPRPARRRVEPACLRAPTSVGFIQNMMPFAERKAAYGADITYGTNSEFGFDYLRDNMAVSKDGLVQRSHAFAIVDEVDSILIDEARTPLIISGEPETAATTYYDFARIVKALSGAPATRKSEKGEDETELDGADYLYDEKHKTVSPAQTAIDKIERALKIENLYDPTNVQLVNHLIQSLKAESLYQSDVDYVIEDGEMEDRRRIHRPKDGGPAMVRRPAPGRRSRRSACRSSRRRRRWRRSRCRTSSSSTRSSPGMTGTAKTEAEEFTESIYNLRSRRRSRRTGPVVRVDNEDRVYRTEREKWESIIEEIKEFSDAGRPVLVGTTSVEKTRNALGAAEAKYGIEHEVLNAKQHEREARSSQGGRAAADNETSAT